MGDNPSNELNDSGDYLIMLLEEFIEGERYTYSEMSLAAGYGKHPGGNFERGIILAPKNNPTSIMIKMNLSKGLYPDSYKADRDWFHYIGDGLPDKGHQELKWGNKIMVENQELPVYLFLRYEDEKKGDPWWFKGRWRITGIERDYISDNQISDGTKQRVFRFKLSKASSLPNERTIFEEHPIVDTYLSEVSYLRATPEILQIIEPKHKKLANQFARWLKNEGFEKITLENNQIDVTFEHHGNRFMSELKTVYALSTTKAIREAMGQVLEYNFYESREPYDEWIVLLDSSPTKIDLEYLGRLANRLNMPLNLGWQKRNSFYFQNDLI